MAKVIAPFKIKGTLGGINFMDTTEGNVARMEREKFMTSDEFYANPIYDRIRDQGKEMGYCAKKSQQFRQLAVQFYRNSKDVSFAGRANQILLEILNEDSLNPKGHRTLEEGLKSPFLNEILVGFEGNKQRPLSQVLLIPFLHDQEKRVLTIPDFNAQHHLDWPEEATHVHLAMATANWDFVNNSFNSCYSEECICTKESEIKTLTLETEKPLGNQLQISYLYIGFAKLERRKYKIFHRRSNTATIIACHYP